MASPGFNSRLSHQEESNYHRREIDRTRRSLAALRRKIRAEQKPTPYDQTDGTSTEDEDEDAPRRMSRTEERICEWASELPRWTPQDGEKAPPLCGAVPADPDYTAQYDDLVAAFVEGDGVQPKWMLARTLFFDQQIQRYMVADVDTTADDAVHTPLPEHVILLPKTYAHPKKQPDTVFPTGSIVMALYPETTCFYRAVVLESPTTVVRNEYIVQFEDTTESTGFGPPISVHGKYVIACSEG